MVLVVPADGADDREQSALPADLAPHELTRRVLANRRLRAEAEKFVAGAVLKLTPSRRCRVLQVMQREAAVCAPHDKQSSLFHAVGSADATTCVLLFVRSPLSERVMVVHMDGAEGQFSAEGGGRCSLRNVLGACFPEAEAKGGLEVYVIGGFNESGSANDSAVPGIVTASLSSLHAWPWPLLLRLACIGPLNTQTLKRGGRKHPPTMPAPIVTGACWLFANVADPEPEQKFQAGIYRADFLACTSKDYIPGMAVRSARFRCEDAHLALVHRDDASGIVQIAPFEYRAFPAYQLRALLSCDDDQLAQYLSSSPLVEPPGFFITIRALLRFMLEHPDSRGFFKDRPLRFRVQDDGTWLQLS